MATVFRRARMQFFCFVTLAATVFATSCTPAQEPPSLVGSRPLWSLTGATGWLNSKPLTANDLKGKVVLVDFWTYSCINCLRSMPYVEAWAEKYKTSGLVVIGVHSPEFGFEQQLPNVQKALRKYGIGFPVALDSRMAIWNGFHNEFWPADYFIDASGKVRYEHFGEGDYPREEQWIQKLLRERGATAMPGGTVDAQGEGAEAATDLTRIESPETYIGYARAQRFASHGGIAPDATRLYALPKHLWQNEWGLSGKWADRGQFAVLEAPGGSIAFRFHARDLHLVLGPAADGKPIRFRVLLDGAAPGNDHGADIDAAGNGVVRSYRLYQLIRQRGGAKKDRTFTIEFEDPGVQAFAFTFG